MPVNQGAVGGQVDLEAKMVTDCQQLHEIGMEQGLPEDMGREEPCIPFKFLQDLYEYRRVHEHFGPAGAMAERAGQIAAVGHFYVNFFEHVHNEAVLEHKKIRRTGPALLLTSTHLLLT